MADNHWQGEGPVFTIESAGRIWTLFLDEDRPYLCWADEKSIARLLGLDHIAAIGRRDESAFTGPSLTAFEQHRGRIQATYTPPGWHGLSVRAAWGPMPDHDGFDLEVQVSATSVGLLRHLEVAVVSTWAPTIFPEDVGFSIVEPRDVHAAALSYDGREPPRCFATSPRCPYRPPLPIPSPRPVTRYRIPGRHRRHSYVEMVQPNDCARRIVRGMLAEGKPYPAQSIRYGLFGHDLEKGVVLRGRIRGVWIDAAVAAEEARRRHEAFLREPPALGP